jgi:hypothetical protein
MQCRRPATRRDILIARIKYCRAPRFNGYLKSERGGDANGYEQC